MARIFTDGAEMQDNLFWSQIVDGSISVVDPPGSPANQVKCYKNYGHGRISFAAGSEFYFRVRMYDRDPNNGYGQAHTEIRFLYDSNEANYALKIVRDAVDTNFDINFASTSASTAVGTGPKDTWILLEIHLKIDNTTGVVEIKKDGTSIYSFTGDTQGSYATVSQIQFYPGYAGYGSNADGHYDDLAMNDVSGGSDNSWCGDGRVVLLSPSGNGSSSQFVGSDADSTDNYALVNELPPDGNTSYVESSTSGHKDMYAIDAFKSDALEIRRVWVESRAYDTSASAAQMKLDLKITSTTYQSDAITLTGAYARHVGPDYTVNPDTSSEWTVSDINGLEAGVEVV